MARILVGRPSRLAAPAMAGEVLTSWCPERRAPCETGARRFENLVGLDLVEGNTCSERSPGCSRQALLVAGPKRLSLPFYIRSHRRLYPWLSVRRDGHRRTDRPSGGHSAQLAAGQGMEADEPSTWTLSDCEPTVSWILVA